MLKNKLVSVLKSDRTPEWFTKNGAIIGDDVELINVQCTAKDATCVSIGNHVTLSHVHLLTHDASTKRFLGMGCNRIGRIVIGDNVFVGVGTIILPNVKIGNNVIVGAGSVVTKSIPDNSVAVGNPAKAVTDIDSFISKHKLEMQKPDRQFFNVNRAELNDKERKNFNDAIDGKIVYLCRK